MGHITCPTNLCHTLMLEGISVVEQTEMGRQAIALSSCYKCSCKVELPSALGFRSGGMNGNHALIVEQGIFGGCQTSTSCPTPRRLEGKTKSYVALVLEGQDRANSAGKNVMVDQGDKGR
ncbi:hypothetical protein VNO78_20745 [Psophocarpus tetragonolobus]|uniref:Uncharacterized protein n=1 Tax=Psophocarpus tetragonolobus TaxID=3891 RepID=A0AAN9SAY1_PSOTE